MPRELAFTAPPALAVAENATSPTGRLGAEIWSTTASMKLVWNGSAWVNAMGSGGGGSGDVVGPDGAPQHSVPLFEGTSGKLLKASPISFYEEVASEEEGSQFVIRLGEGKSDFSVGEYRSGVSSSYPYSDGRCSSFNLLDLPSGKRIAYETGTLHGYGFSVTDPTDNYTYASNFSKSYAGWTGSHYSSVASCSVNSESGDLAVTASAGGTASAQGGAAQWGIKSYATPADASARYIRFIYSGAPLDFSAGGEVSDIKFSFGVQGQFGIGASRSYGTAGQVLTSGGPSAAPSWQTPSGGDVGITYSGTVVRLTNTSDKLVVGASADDGSGAKLQVTGTVAIKGGSPGVGKVLTSDADGLASWQAPSSGGALPFEQAFLTSAVSMPTTGTWYDGPGVTLTEGTWLVTTNVQFLRSATTATQWISRISTGTTHYASGQQYQASVSGQTVQINLTAVVVLTGTTTVKIQSTTSAGAAACSMQPSTPASGSGNNATSITAVRLA